MKVTTTRGINYALPALDAADKPIKSRKKFNGREVTVIEHDHFRVEAERVIDVPEHIAKEWIAKGYARKFDEALDDDDANPVKLPGEGNDDALN